MVIKLDLRLIDIAMMRSDYTMSVLWKEKKLGPSQSIASKLLLNPIWHDRVPYWGTVGRSMIDRNKSDSI